MNAKVTKESGDGGDDSVIAAEYVLGLLDAEAHDRVTLRLTGDPALQQEVRFWQQRFASLDESFEEATPPPALFGRIEARLFDTIAYSGPFAALWNNLSLWRGLAAGGLAVAIVAAGFTLLQPQTSGPAVAPTQYAAALEADGSSAKFLAVYDSSSGHVRLAALSGEEIADRDYELWFIEGDNAPISLGVVPITGNSEIVLAEDLRSRMSPGVVFAVTLEPKGGGPEGKPTGPVVAAGAVATI